MPFLDPRKPYPITLADGTPYRETVQLAVVIDHPLLALGARAQVIAYLSRRNGLSNAGPDDGPQLDPIPRPVWPWPEQDWFDMATLDDLREVVAIKMIATDLERVGDLARNIAKSALRLGRRLDAPIPSILTRLAASAQGVLRSALDAFSHADPRAAHAVLGSDDEIDDAQDEVILEELEQIASHPDMASPAVDIIFIAKNLERVGDHATNIAEDVILVAEARNVKHAAKLSR